MAENTPATGTPTTNPAVPPAQQPGGATPPKSEEHMIPKSRLDEESSKRQAAEARLAELEAASKAAETKQLEDNKKFEELYKKEKESHTATQSRINEVLRRSAFIAALSGKQVASIEDAYILAKPQLDALKVAEGDKVEGIEDIVNKLLTDKPYLVTGAKGAVGSPTNPAGGAGTAENQKRIYTHAEINAMSQSEFDKNRDDINRAAAEGRIRDKA